MIKPYNLKMRSGLYYKCFMIVIYDCKGTFEFAVYLTIAIYKFFSRDHCHYDHELQLLNVYSASH